MIDLIHLRAGKLAAAIDPMGAQLSSLQLEGCEYLWQGSPAYWGRRAPILFPIVGSLRNGRAESAQGPCVMGRHGVARNFEHEVVAHDALSATFELRENAETLAAYPYRFKLNTTYTIAGEATLSQTFTVANPGDAPLPFCVGGHPAFNVPVPGPKGETFEDYVLEFDEPWTCALPLIGEDGLMSWDNLRECPSNSATVALTHRSFDHDALMFTDVPGRALTLRGTKSGHGVRVEFPDFTYIGVWSAANDAPFVALEPWTGHTTAHSESDIFEEKAGMTILQPGETKRFTFGITLF